MRYPRRVPYDPELLDLLREAEEVEIETAAGDGTTHRTIIWVVVVEGGVFVRSYRGPNARWYREALRHPDITLIVGGRRLDGRVVPGVDSRSIGLVSDELLRKYATDSATPAMVRPEVLDTTLRVDPVPAREADASN